MGKVYKLGLDIGSTTIKVVLLDGEKIIHSDYQRHHSDVSGLLNELFEDLRTKTTQEEYRQKLMEIQSLFYEDCPFICLYFRMGNVITRHMYTTCRDVREYELLRGIESYRE